MPGIFISYRREDSAGHAGRLVKHQIWYAPKVKRVVKHARDTYAPKGNDLDKDVYELVEYKLN